MQGGSLFDPDPRLANRPLFASSQLYLAEDAAVWKGGIGVVDHRAGTQRLYGDGDALNPSRCACILDFRAYQLRYHDSLDPLSPDHRPPRWRDCTPRDSALSTCTALPER